MFLTIIILAFILGTIIGSFLGVVTDRHNTGRNINGRSFCFSCSVKLRPKNLIPILSFLFQGGKCSSCKSKLSGHYLAIEVITGLVFAVIASIYFGLIFVSPWIFFLFFTIGAILWSLLIIILFYDIRHMIIPDRFMLPFILLSIGALFLSPIYDNLIRIPGLMEFVYPILLALPFLLIWVFSKGKAFGFGDIKLILGIGFFLGISMGITAVIFGFWLGAIFSIIMLLLKKNNLNLKSEIPFAPFLIIGTFISFVFKIDFMSLVKVFSF